MYIFIIVIQVSKVCYCTGMLLYWYVAILVCRTGMLPTGMLLYWYVTYWYVTVLVCYLLVCLLYWYVTVLVCYRTSMLLYWYVTVLVCYCTGMLPYWYVTVLVETILVTLERECHFIFKYVVWYLLLTISVYVVSFDFLFRVLVQKVLFIKYEVV